MAFWTLYDYFELTGRNPIRIWLDDLPDGDRAKIDYRLQQMVGMEKWSEKWASKYQGTDEIIELRITVKRPISPLGCVFRADAVHPSQWGNREGRQNTQERY